jgi:hypothetical protein
MDRQLVPIHKVKDLHKMKHQITNYKSQINSKYQLSKLVRIDVQNSFEYCSESFRNSVIEIYLYFDACYLLFF